MPATTEVWVNDARAQPWFFVTTEANDHLLAAIERDILAPLRKEVGAQRRVTLVFDREGWSPKAFARWAAAGFDVMTYRKGRYDPWPEDTFVAVVDPTPSRGGKPVTWRLAERETDLGTGRGQPVFRMREVRRLCDNGHQTSIMTTRPRDTAGRLTDVCALAPGELLPLYAPGIQPRPPVHLRDRALLPRVQSLHTHAWLATTDASQTHRAALGAQLQDLNERIGEHRGVTKSLPHKVPVGETLDPDTVVRLEPERKIFTDLVRTLAYRAESALLGRVGPLPARDGEEGRAFLKALFATPADLVPNDTELLVRFHSMAQPRLNRALRALCEAATDERHLYPGTSLRMVFEGGLARLLRFLPDPARAHEPGKRGYAEDCARICGDSGTNGPKRFKELRRRGLSTFPGGHRRRLADGVLAHARHVAVQQALRNHHFDLLGLPRLYTPAEA